MRRTSLLTQPAVGADEDVDLLGALPVCDGVLTELPLLEIVALNVRLFMSSVWLFDASIVFIPTNLLGCTSFSAFFAARDVKLPQSKMYSCKPKFTTVRKKTNFKRKC